MGMKLVFNRENSKLCPENIELAAYFIQSKEAWWNQYMQASGQEVALKDILPDLGYSLDRYDSEMIDLGYWNKEDLIDFGMTFDENGNILLNFNCPWMHEKPAKKKPCYFWKIYKYYVDADKITLKGWIQWCNELFELQHDKKRPESNRLYITPNMEKAMVKARVWNRKKIEKWLDDHGYPWTMVEEIKYQFAFDDPNDVILIDSDAELAKKNNRKAV